MGGFFSSKKIRCCHILVKDQAKAEQILGQLVAGSDFSEQARAHSECPSKSRGGDLGAFGKGQMVPEFEKAAYGLQVGQTSSLVKTKFGFHIIRRTA